MQYWHSIVAACSTSSNAELEILAGDAHGDNDLAAAISRAPDEIAVVPAYGLGQPVPWAEEIYGSRFSVVAGKDAALGPVLTRNSPRR